MYNIIVEFYADGNIILCDNNYKIIANIRNYKNDYIDIKVGNIYPMEYFDNKLNTINYLQLYEFYNQNNNNDIYTIFKDCQLINKLGLTIIKHCSIKSNNNFETFYQFIQYFINLFINNETILKSNSYYIYDNNNIIDIIPFIYSFYDNNKYIELDSLSKAYNKYFQDITNIKQDKVVKKNKNKNKIDNINKSNLNKIKQLENKINTIHKNIEWIYENLKSLDNLLNFIQNNQKYNTIEYLNNNYINNHFNNNIIIHKIDYKNNNINIIDKNNKIDINLNYKFTIYININHLYENNKKIINKKDKTIIENHKIINKMIKQINNNDTNIINKIDYKYKSCSYWFQQFHWTITSNKLLFIIGNSAEQNELIVKKYLDNNTHYFHADFNGSPSGILYYPNNKNDDIYIKDRLDCNEFLLSHTKLWKDKIYDKCFYVDNTQVSKTPPTGEYINQGSFMIYGKKNYLSLSQYDMGIGLLFVLDNNENNNNLIGNFIENPNKNDEIIYCIPIFASYKSLSNYKYKIKIIPGKQKKNKIIKTIISYFIKLSNNDRETFLIKKIDKNILDKCIIPNSQLVLSNK